MVCQLKTPVCLSFSENICLAPSLSSCMETVTCAPALRLTSTSPCTTWARSTWRWPSRLQAPSRVSKNCDTCLKEMFFSFPFSMHLSLHPTLFLLVCPPQAWVWQLYVKQNTSRVYSMLVFLASVSPFQKITFKMILSERHPVLSASLSFKVQK